MILVLGAPLSLQFLTFTAMFSIHFKVGDPVILVFDNGARGFLSLPRPLFGSECDDNNAAGIPSSFFFFLFEIFPSEAIPEE